MSLKADQMLLCMFLCFLVSINAVYEGQAYTLQNEDPIVVLFDEGHGQFFNRTLYQQAISVLIDSGKKVVFSTEKEFNRSSFEGIDIFVSTNPKNSFSFEERYFIREFIQEGKSILLLANPLVENNETLNGRGDKLNDVLTDPEVGILAEFWTRPDDVGSVKSANVVQNEFYNLGRPEYIKIEVNSSVHEILSLNENVTSIVTYSCSIKSPLQDVLIAPSYAISKTTHNEIYDYASDITLISTAGRQTEAKILLGGSSIMFSDLTDALLGNKTWFESENNSVLWENMFDWLAEIEESESADLNTLETAFIPLLTLSVTSILSIAFGSVIYSYGSGKKIVITKSIESSVEAREATEEKPQLSSRERRLQQIKRQRRNRRE
ncbi:MAG: hypothetical protein EAX86_11455 [Candidatus Heimdallarchaeota archaeon]|nr:hypothetical protein [Candidatus Heimdallarchaeota archaeon]